MTKPSKPPNRPTDPNKLAQAVASEAVGDNVPPPPLPAHVAVLYDTACCEKCGKTLALSNGTKVQSEDLRAFGIWHRHGT